mmetsp:Transcript_24316/g.60604  ORF Transcript_24316/g.60604 Transcript_24316/m.60604 type:complete len:101 (+) Transcript_24316:99-401(+)
MTSHLTGHPENTDFIRAHSAPPHSQTERRTLPHLTLQVPTGFQPKGSTLSCAPWSGAVPRGREAREAREAGRRKLEREQQRMRKEDEMDDAYVKELMGEK